MRKLTLLITTLLCYVGVLHAEALVADGVYTLSADENKQRGELVAANGYNYPVLDGIDLTNYTSNSTAAKTNGQYWYVKSAGQGDNTYYLYNIAESKYLVNENGNVNFGDTPYVWTFVTNANKPAYLNIKDAAKTDNDKVWLSSGCGRTAAQRPVQWDKNNNDGGALYTFTYVDNYFATPETGKYYKIKGDGELPWVTADVTSGGNVVVSADEADAAVFLKTANGLQAFATGKYLGYSGGKYTYSDTELAIELRQNDGYLANYSNKYAIVSGGNYMFNNSSDGIVHESNGELQLPRLWAFIEVPVAQVGEQTFYTFAEAAAAAQAGSEIKLLANIEGDITVPANVTLNGNGYAVSGIIVAAGDITFAGVTTAADLDFDAYSTVVNIPAGASLQLNGSARMSIGFGTTFNITGTIENAKTADKATLTPSLVIPGASFSGSAGVKFNVTNAYISVPSSYCSTSKTASGTFDFNITNSIWESAGKLAFEEQSVNAKVDFALVNSVLTTGSHLVFGTASGEEGVVIDNSLVNQGTSRQIENRGTMTIKNGAVVNGAVATSSNAINPGTIIVENATYAVTGEFSGAAEGTGTLIVKKGATVSAGSITKANIQIDATGMAIGDEINLTANLANHAGTLEVVNNDNLTAKIVDGKIVLAEKPAAKIGDVEYTTLEAAFKAATSGCTIDILSDVTVDYNWDARYTGGKFTVPVTINGNDKTIKFTASVNENNYQAPFRFEADATVNGLIIDMSEVTDNRFRAISSKGNLTVDGCKFIGKDETLNCRAVIFGEGAGANVGNLAISITNSEFINWKRGITDNENAQDVKTVTITGNTLTDAGVVVSAKETVTFTGNTVAGAYVNIKSYTAGNKLAVTATGNALEANTTEVGKFNVIDAGGVVNAEGFNVVAKGNDFTGYTRGDAIWGEVWGNATESFVIKVLDANGNVMGTTSLNNVNGIINGDVNVTWSLKLDAASNTDEYWTMAWTTAPTIDNMPAKVELWVDGVKVSGGNVVLNGPDEIAKIYAAVTDASGKILGYHTDIQEAIKAAAAVTSVAKTATAGTVEILRDVTVDKWVMFADKMSVGDGSLITLNINGVTIDGNGKTLTVKSIESASNGGYLFYDAQNLTVKDLTINIADGLVGGIGLQSGTISNVTFNGGQYAVLPGKNGVTIDGCTFNDTKGYAIYYEDARPGIVVDGNTFNTAEGKYAITMRSDEQFTNNTITKGRVNLANSAASTVSGNDFGEERFKVYNGATATISNNKIDNLVFNETTAPAASTFTADNTLSAEAQAAIDALPVMAGDGTEANPYTIGNLAQLKAFRDDVNAGNNYQGKFVKLTADIDLNNEEWTPIAYNGKTFKGTFDGGNKIIKNLKITKTLTNSAENNGIGLFGRTDDPATIKNFTIENVDITGSLYVGAAVGLGYTGKLVENVTVKGNIAIDAWWYAGVIGGNGYMNTINNCHVIGNDGSYIKGNNGSYIGGIWGFRGEGANKITNCTVTNLDIQGVDRVGGISGIGHYGNSIEGCSVNNVNVTATDPDATTVGIIIGACQGTEEQPTTFADNTVQTVTVKIGDAVVENPGLYGTNINGGNAVTNYVAKIGNVYYESLAEAVSAAQSGATITLIANETFTEDNRYNNGGWWDGLGYSGDKSFTIDLANFTISQNGALNDYLMWFKNDGAKANTITLKNGTLDAGTTAYCALATASSNAQKITVNLENIKVINNNNNGSTVKVRGGAELNVTAGTVITGKDSYLGIECSAATVNIYDGAEIYMNGTSSNNGCLAGVGGNGTINVYGGEGQSKSGGFIAMTSGGTINIEGGEWTANTDGTYANSNKSVLVAQSDKQYNAGAGNSIVNVTGGTFKGGYNCYGNAVGDAQINIKGGNFNANPTSYVAEGFAALPNLDGEFVVGAAPTATVNNLGMTTVPAGDYSIWDGSFDQNTEDDGDMPLSFVMQFLADQDEEDMANSPYADWYGDFVLTFTGLENGSFTADGCYLAGHYGSFGWVKVPVDGMTIEEGVRYPVMLGVGLGQKYDYICSSVEDFKCALYLTPEILAANPNIQVKLELGVVDNSKGSDAAATALINKENVYSVTEYTYNAEDFVAAPAVAKIGDVEYKSFQDALNAAAAGTGNVTVSILADVDLTGVDWNPVTVSAPGYPVVTVEGNDKTITGLNDMLFAGTWAGGSGLIIKNLTIENSAIVNDKDDTQGTVGVGAFIGYPQASATITLEDCHLKNSSVEGGHWTGGLIGMAGGYNGNDGPVFMNLTIKDCSVTESTITGKGSVGGVIGHGSCAAWTNVVIEGTTVSNNTITSTGSSNVKAGAVMGTIGAAGQPTTANGETKTGGMSVSATVAENDVKSNGTVITTIYGRQGTPTGMLAVAGGTYDNYPIEEGVAYAAPAAGYKIEQNTDGTYGVVVDPVYGKVAKIGDAYYETLAAAITAAQPNDVITFLTDITEDVTVSKNVTIDGADKKYTGKMTGNAGLNVTVQNVNFVNGGFAKTTKSTTGSYTIKDCTFDGAGTFAYPLSFKGANTVNVENCTVKDYLYSFLYVSSGTNSVSVKDVTVDNCPSYAVYFSSGVNNAMFENLTVKNSNNGFVINNTANRAFTMKNCKMENVNTAINHSNGTYTITCTALGVNDLGTAALSEYAVIKGATIEGSTLYGSVQSMVEKAENGQTVKLLSDITMTEADCVAGADRKVLVDVAGKDITLDMNGKKISVTHMDEFTNDYIVAVIRVADGAGLTVIGNGTIDVKVHNGNPDIAYMFWKRGTTGHLTIENGTFKMNDSADSMVYTNGDEIVFVKGGSWTLDSYGTRGNREPWIFNVKGAGDNHVVVTGGTYNADINRQFWSNEVVVPETHYTIANDDNTYTVKEGAVAYVNEGMLTGPYFIRKNIGYATLAEAVAEVDDNETVTLLQDVTLTDALVIEDGMDVTVSGEGKTITGCDGKDVFYVKGGKLTLTEGLNVHATTDCAIYLRGGDVFTAANLTKSGSKYSVIQGNGNYAGNVTITGGKVEASDGLTAIYWPQNGKLTITGGEITGHSAVYIASGSLEITGGKLHGVGANGSYEGVTGGSANAPGEALTIENVGGNSGYEEISSVVITGGTFISDNAKAVGSYANTTQNPDAEPVAGFISGGIFNTPVEAAHCATGYAPYANENGTYGVESLNIDELTIVDGEYTEFKNLNAKTVGTLTYKRNMTNYVGKWQPLYVPFEIPVSKLTELGYQVAIFYDVHFELTDEGDLDLTSAPDLHILKITSGTLKPNYPYVIKASADHPQLSLELSDVKLYSTAESEMNSVESGSTITRFIFAGTYAEATPGVLTGDANIPCYAINKEGKFQKMGSGANLPAFRVYMSIVAKDGSHVILAENAAESIRMRVIGEEAEDGTTIIYDVEMDAQQTVDYIYDLQGRRVLEPQKGNLYIINGKKVIF